jgi:spermidine synthase
MRSTTWLILMFSTGLCSMVYELALAQLLGGIMGNALARFATTLGVYVTGLGLGSILFKPQSEWIETRAFIQAEVGLVLVGFLSPILFTLAYASGFSLFESASHRSLFILVVTHSIIFVTGFLSGFELPVLSAISERQRPGSSTSVLVADYAGMFLGSLVFPLILFPLLGLISAFWIATALNLAAALCAYLLSGRRSVLMLSAFFFSAAINVVGLIFSADVQLWLGRLYVSRV